MAFHQLIKTQFVPATIEEVWDFISSPKNLKEITPDYMGFDIISENLPDKMYAGMIIAYKVRPLLGIPMTWVTEITHVIDRQLFVDEQRFGPYRFWHHQHHFRKTSEGTEVRDLVHYALPFGPLGRLIIAMVIKARLKQIFDYRVEAIKTTLGSAA
ncbi:MAG: SRPBCC family protein [Anaerolineales bacterium]|nr:SRPBCC family protein [Anaerolineales bacterium]